VEERLERAMRHTYQRATDFSEKHDCSLRIACYGLALERLSHAYVERGIFP
jgi:glutamate dehydrogenase/leucine dehydrogenase